MQRLACLGTYALQALVVKGLLKETTGSTGTVRSYEYSFDSGIKQETADPSLEADLSNQPKGTEIDARPDEAV